MAVDGFGRREFLRTVGSAGLMAGVPALAEMSAVDPSRVVHEIAEPEQGADEKPKHSIKFAVCGMSHDHIYGMVGAIQRGGGILVSVYGAEPDKLATFTKRFPDAKVVKSEDEKNEIWNAIKTVPDWQTDIVGDIKVSPQAAATMAAGAGGAGTAAGATYTVKSGDTLSGIAKNLLGDASKYTKIFEMNRDQLSDPDKIKPGQVLKIPSHQ